MVKKIGRLFFVIIIIHSPNPSKDTTPLNKLNSLHVSRSPSICRLSLDDLYYKAYLLKQMTTIFVYVCSMLETIAIIWRSATSGFAHYKRDSSYFFFVMEEKGSKNYNNHRHIHINFFFISGKQK